MTVHVRFFAAAADAAGTDAADVPHAPTPTELRAALEERFGPEFARVLAQCTLLIDGERTPLDADVELPAGARVDVLPPFAGG